MLRRRAPRLRSWPSQGVNNMFYAERKQQAFWNKKFAWIPTRVSQNRWVLWTDFYQKETRSYLNNNLDSIFIQCYSKEDYITMKLTGQI